jgi:hypothetical protein
MSLLKAAGLYACPVVRRRIAFATAVSSHRNNRRNSGDHSRVEDHQNELMQPTEGGLCQLFVIDYPCEHYEPGREHRETTAEGLLPGVTINTNATHFAPIKQFQLRKFKGERWELLSEVISSEVGG